MNISGLAVTKEAREGFYPTPPSVADEMLTGIDWRMIETVLEPEAGKGNLIYEIAKRYRIHRDSYGAQLDLDYCEIDPNLREICKYNIVGKIYELQRAKEPLDNIRWGQETPEQKRQKNALDFEISVRESVDIHLVHDDFLSYQTHKHYDLIVMNPPFSEGAAHLLKALRMQRYGGSICCVLNAETIRNPYTEERRYLLRELKRLGANIKYIANAFSTDAERKADVDVAIIKVTIPEAEFESTIYERMKKATEPDYIPDAEIHALVAGDYIEQAIQMYQTETAATLELVKEYKALVPYMYVTLDENGMWAKEPILRLTFGSGCGSTNAWRANDFNVKKYMRIVRLKYWRALFSNEKFIGRLTSELRKKFFSQVEKMADYEFSAFNIKQVLVEMNASMTKGVEDAIMNLFDELTVEHSWYPECQQNRHYYNGWATNKAHKIGPKCIIPVNGMFSSYSWDKDKGFDVGHAYDVVADLEKAFDYLDGGRTAEIDLCSRLRMESETGQTRNIPCKYFKIDLFKKGTMHIKFYPDAMKLVERLNIYASQKKGWLPPNYGRAKYGNMEADERAVVDSFHGDGSTGSGAKVYAEVLAKADYYLAEPTQKMPALMAPTE